MKFYFCTLCKELVHSLVYDESSLICCGKEMIELTVNSKDASHEKHLPVVNEIANGYHVKIGEISHPQTPEHHIDFVTIVVDNKIVTTIKLSPTDSLEFDVICKHGETVEVYSYCNLHGLFLTTIRH